MYIVNKIGITAFDYERSYWAILQLISVNSSAKRCRELLTPYGLLHRVGFRTRTGANGRITGKFFPPVCGGYLHNKSQRHGSLTHINPYDSYRKRIRSGKAGSYYLFWSSWRNPMSGTLYLAEVLVNREGAELLSSSLLPVARKLGPGAILILIFRSG